MCCSSKWEAAYQLKGNSHQILLSEMSLPGVPIEKLLHAPKIFGDPSTGLLGIQIKNKNKIKLGRMEKGKPSQR